jgi:hypothetical protein
VSNICARGQYLVAFSYELPEKKILATFLEATYIGQSATFTRDHAYQIEVVQHLGRKLTVIATRGYAHKRVMSSSVTYPDLAAFLKNWQITKVIQPNYTDGRGPTP